MFISLPARPLRGLIVGLFIALALSFGAARAEAATKPTVVLVHGAFADASGWNGVISILRDKGYPVIAPPNPLRGVSADADYMKHFLSTIPGPIILVGHSYGGVVITNAATGNPNVKALVYVAAYGPEQGETVSGLGEKIAGGMIGPATLDFRPYADVEGAIEGYIKRNVFRKIFAADLPKRDTDLMALTQRGAAVAALGEPSGVPAWKTIPSWYIVAGQDFAIGTKLEQFMAKRMNAKTTLIKGASHVVFISQPKKTAKVILDAATAKG